MFSKSALNVLELISITLYRPYISFLFSEGGEEKTNIHLRTTNLDHMTQAKAKLTTRPAGPIE